MAHGQHSTISKRWDLQVTFPDIYKVRTYVRNSLFTYMHALYKHCMLSALMFQVS